MFKAVLNSITSSGSDALISGVPSVVDYYSKYMDYVEKNLKNSMSTVTTSYEKQLRDQAIRKGWADNHKSISVSYNSDAMEMSITGDPVSEYGTGKEPPRSVIRTAIANIQDLEDMINGQIKKDLM